MTKDDAIKVVKILKWADGGCSTCVRELAKDFMKEFPGILTIPEILALLNNEHIEADDFEVSE